MPDSSLLPFDAKLANAASLRLGPGFSSGNSGAERTAARVNELNRVRGLSNRIKASPTSAGSGIPFQFAPRVTSEDNASKWIEIDVFGMEPVKIHKGSQGRKLNLQWEYVATDSTFNCAKVAGCITSLKAYFFEFPKVWTAYPIVYFKYGLHVPVEATFRLMNLNVTHGPEYCDNGGIYPIYTQCTASLELVTDISDANSRSGGKSKGRIKIEPLKTVKKEWY